MNQLFNLETLTEILISYLPKVGGAILTLIIGFWLIGWITKFVSKTLHTRNIDKTIRPFIISLLNVGLKVMVLFTAAGMFGIETTSFVALFGALAFAVGMALQGSLGHFASGVMLLVFKPYKVGDLVDIAGNIGTVEEIQVFNTLLITPDNKKIVIPNGVITTGVITNISGQGEIRVDMTFGIGYEDNIDEAKKVFEQVARRCPQVLNNKPVEIFVSELADSSVNFVVRPWAKSVHYWDVYFYMQEYVKKELDNNNISIPYPQMDLHMVNQNDLVMS